MSTGGAGTWGQGYRDTSAWRPLWAPPPCGQGPQICVGGPLTVLLSGHQGAAPCLPDRSHRLRPPQISALAAHSAARVPFLGWGWVCSGGAFISKPRWRLLCRDPDPHHFLGPAMPHSRDGLGEGFKSV